MLGDPSAPRPDMQIESFPVFAMAPRARHRRLAGSGTTARPHPRNRWFCRLVAAIMLLTFVPVVSAMLVCDVHCMAQALAGIGESDGAEGHGASGDSGAHGFGDHLKDAGRCHSATTPMFTAGTESTSAAASVDNQWFHGAALSFATVAWPPPRPRPKFIVS